MAHIEFAETLEDLNHDCKDHLQLCVRHIGSKGNTSYINRCTFCGVQIGNAIPKSSIQTPLHFYDAELIRRFEEKWKELFTLSVGEGSTAYEQPLKFEEFEERFDQFFLNLSAEKNVNVDLLINYLWRYLNKETEIRRHDYKTPFKSEEDLQAWLSNELSRWFEVHSEVNGVGFVNRVKRNVRIDFIIKAKPELVALGFTDKYLGIEVKNLNPGERDSFHKRSARGIFQALSYWYSGARWTVGTRNDIEICAVLFFSDLSFTDQRDQLFESIDKHYRKSWNAYLGIANHGNVGELIFDGSSDNYFKWRMNFAHSTYFTGYKNGDLIMGNHNLIDKLRIGSSNL
ncbi:hypothetical protein [Cellvibrio sp. pealriver]|uniref:hypothetical protein n=1 Tax=Cellvibrio sp. pealriver TaxID=1622269 RepID=UPI00066FEFA9|nr:hypothetical protein [Cellvibrio sp. pealriver]